MYKVKLQNRQGAELYDNTIILIDVSALQKAAWLWMLKGQTGYVKVQNYFFEFCPQL